MGRIWECDVLVVGGGVAGVAAAIGAAQAGAKTVLMERESCLGGISTNSGISTFCGFFDRSSPPNRLVGGVGEKVVSTLSALGEDTVPVLNHLGYPLIDYDIERLKLALDRVIKESPVSLFLHASVVGVESYGNTIKAISCQDDEGSFGICAGSYVDATGDANLAHLAGAEMVVAENESPQNATLVMWLGGVDPKQSYHPDDVGLALHKAQDKGYGPFTKMSGRVRFSKRGGFAILALANYKPRRLDSTCWTEAELFGREQINAYVRALNDFLPGMEQAYLLRTGPNIGVRQSRRILGENMLSFTDAVSAKRFDDGIARGGWAFEVHTDLNAMSNNDHVLDKSYYHIPIGCLKAKRITNLWAGGRNICVDSITHGSTRAMGTSFATGQAAGVSPAISVSGRGYSVQTVQQELMLQGAYPI